MVLYSIGALGCYASMESHNAFSKLANMGYGWRGIFESRGGLSSATPIGGRIFRGGLCYEVRYGEFDNRCLDVGNNSHISSCGCT